jgi:hypothetical protein
VLGGAAYYTASSFVEFKDFQIFEKNFANQGGAIAFSTDSTLILNEPLQADFVNNNGKDYGGAIFIEDELTISKCLALNNKRLPESRQEICFDFIMINLNCTDLNMSAIQLKFVNNTAGIAGTIIHGGNLDLCKFVYTSNCPIHSMKYMDNAIQVFQSISYIDTNDSVTSTISSDPFQVCVCSKSGENVKCDDPLATVIGTVTGKDFTIPVVTVGQNKGIVPSIVRASLRNDIQIGEKQRLQYTGKKCTPLTYRLFSANELDVLTLFPDGPCRDTGISSWSVIVAFEPCPSGFSLSGSECMCVERLQKYTTNCSVNGELIERLSNTFWMGVLNVSGHFEGFILHPSCPLDYCMDTPVYVKLNNIDIQCNHNHSGTLCGSCKKNYSVAFGTLHCLPCNNRYLSLIIPFAFAGIGLVIILLLLQLTVASGTMNGLIFYVNVIQASRSVFFSPGDTNVLTVFVAWMNLDLGIETCFYDGMSVYGFTWLQFLFPFYVWFLIFLIIKLSRHSRRIARVFGTNPVSTLATLVLLSYSKLLRAIILALSTTNLEYPDGTLKQVWFYDGSIPYFRRVDHILLGAFAIAILLFLFLPFTLLLLFGQFLQAYSHLWILSWLNKIKPFMDAYYAPYKKQTRYWTGLLLLVRCALFLTFALTTQGNNNFRIDLVVITSISAGLATIAWIHRGIYEKISLDILESSFILNLCVFAVATYHVNKSRQHQTGISYGFVGLSFA